MSTAVTYLEHAPTTAAETAELHRRMDRARRTRHQARLIANGEVIAAGPWRDDHLAAVVDRRRILDYLQEHGAAGSAEIASRVDKTVSGKG